MNANVIGARSTLKQPVTSAREARCVRRLREPQARVSAWFLFKEIPKHFSIKCGYRQRGKECTICTHKELLFCEAIFLKRSNFFSQAKAMRGLVPALNMIQRRRVCSTERLKTVIQFLNLPSLASTGVKETMTSPSILSWRHYFSKIFSFRLLLKEQERHGPRNK